MPFTLTRIAGPPVSLQIDGSDGNVDYFGFIQAVSTVTAEYSGTHYAKPGSAPPAVTWFSQSRISIDISQAVTGITPPDTVAELTPTVSSVDVACGNAAGGTAIALTGTNFRTGATVTVG